MSYVCIKPITLFGNSYMPGEIIQDGHVLPSRERALVNAKCIAEVAGNNDLPAAELIQVETGEEVTFTIPVVQESDGDTAQVMGVPLTEGEVQHIFSVMQMNAEEAAKAIKEIFNENVLIVLHAADSRKTVKDAARKQAGSLPLAEG